METMPCSADNINNNRSPDLDRRLELEERRLEPVVGTNGRGQQAIPVCRPCSAHSLAAFPAEGAGNYG